MTREPTVEEVLHQAEVLSELYPAPEWPPYRGTVARALLDLHARHSRLVEVTEALFAGLPANAILGPGDDGILSVRVGSEAWAEDGEEWFKRVMALRAVLKDSSKAPESPQDATD